MSKNYEIDNTDLQIIVLLTEGARIPYTGIAKQAFVSGKLFILECVNQKKQAW